MKKLLFSAVFLGQLVLSQVVESQVANAQVPSYKANAGDFFYSQQTMLTLVYEVPLANIHSEFGILLDKLELEVSTFDSPDTGYIYVKPMAFSAEFGVQSEGAPGLSTSTEIEVTLLTHPRGQDQADGNIAKYLSSPNGSKTGQLRLFVICDNEIAVAAGRVNFGEHKFLGSFNYSYPTPNTSVGKDSPLKFQMSTYTWDNSRDNETLIMDIKANLAGLKSSQASPSPELLYSSFPPEPLAADAQNVQTVGEFRYYAVSSQLFLNLNRASPSRFEVQFGLAQGGKPLAPVKPFGDGQEIEGSEAWSHDMMRQVKVLLTDGKVVAAAFYRSPSAEYETKPFVVR